MMKFPGVPIDRSPGSATSVKEWVTARTSTAPRGSSGRDPCASALKTLKRRVLTAGEFRIRAPGFGKRSRKSNDEEPLFGSPTFCLPEGGCGG